MSNLLDRQGILDNLTATETTARLLVNAFVKKNSDTELCLNGIYREELITQTATFLSQAQQLIKNLSNTYNLTTDGFFEKKFIDTNEQFNSMYDISHNSEDEIHDSKTASSENAHSSSSSSITLKDIIKNRLTPDNLVPDYPLLRDTSQPNLVILARDLRQTDNINDILIKVYSQIFNYEEQMSCSYDSINGKLPYPRHKRLLFDLIIKLTLNEHEKILDDNERHNLYIQCEKQFSTETDLTNYQGVNIDHLNDDNNSYDEKQFICSLFRLVIPKEDIKKIIAAKQNVSSQWNDNEICIYYARPIHLLWIKQKWLERYPLNSNDELEKWSQCIDWAIDSFLESTKSRPSKRKTIEGSTNHKRVKTPLTLQERFKQIDRTKFDVFEYATKLLQHISNENNNDLPTLEQLKLFESYIMRFYWTSDQQKTWSQILDIISNIFIKESYNDFRQFYSKKLLEMNKDDQIEIDRLLQITL
ncbi:unnamed protein product [Adineta steineri]|uniref:Uncharacterized protein n=1 Tax=Adineta steineri TaxID=433720 RepID=A0A815J547_9BILA|nr:unnamed protein product [Adineta steineri]